MHGTNRAARALDRRIAEDACLASSEPEDSVTPMSAPSSPRPVPCDCTTFLTALDAVVDGEADALTVARAEVHAQACVPCAQRLAATRGYKRRLRRAGVAERAPSELRDAVLAAMRGMHGSRTR